MELHKSINFTNAIAWQLEPINDYIYILNLKLKNFIILEDIGKEIWLMISQKKRINDIVNQLSIEYDMDTEIVKTDVLELIDNLIIQEVLKYDD